MKEDFLHYVWKFQKFDTERLQTTDGQVLNIQNPGTQNQNAGPDFFNGLIVLDGQQWAGNIEIHVKSSQWYTHKHHEDKAYDTVTLHVVWKHDRTVRRSNGSVIPTLELKHNVNAKTLAKYRKLFTRKPTWIPCEKEFHLVDDLIFQNWLERLYIERLEYKSEALRAELSRSDHDWEAMFFRMLCKNFGLKVNGESFYSIGASIDFSTVRKCGHDRKLLEALFFGQAGMLETTEGDAYYLEMKAEYDFLKLKFRLINNHVIRPKYFRLRPSNFPGIRLAQLADLYSKQRNLFSEVIWAKDSNRLVKLLECCAGPYWETHYRFGTMGPESGKKLSDKFKDLVILNTIIPVQLFYARSFGKHADDECLEMAASIESEENTVIDKFRRLRTGVSNSLESQALLQLKKHYCDKKRCLSCEVGNQLLKG